MLLGAVGPHQVEFFEISEQGSGPAEPLAFFEIAADADNAPLAGPRLAAASHDLAALVFSRSGAVRAALLDPRAGVMFADLKVSAAGEWASQPSVVASPEGFTVAYVTVGSSGRSAVALGLSPEGVELWRASVAPTELASAAVVSASPSAHLVVLRTHALSLFSVTQGSLAFAGSLPVSATAGAVWAREGSLHGLFSTAGGLARIIAPLDSPQTAAFTPVAGGAYALELAASDSADGLLVAAVRMRSSTLLLRETSIGTFSSGMVSDVRSAAAASDAYGLARAALLRDSAYWPTLETLTAGDADAVAVTLEGPGVMLPTESGTFTATVRAVRSPVTLVGLDVDVPPGWSVAPPSGSVSLAEGQTAALSFGVGAPAGTPQGAYTITVRPAVVEAPYAVSAALQVSVPSGASVQPFCCSGTVDLLPGGSTVVSVTLVNRGASGVVSQVLPVAPAGLIVSPAVQTVSLAPGSTAQVAFTVSVSQGTAPLDGGTLTLRVIPSDLSPSTDVSMPARIRAVFAPELAFTPRDLSAPPGARQDLDMAIVNTGNVGGVVRLSASVEGIDASALSGLNPSMFVPAFTRVDLALVLTVPPGALAGTAFEVTVAAAHALSGAPAGAPASLTGSVEPSRSFRASLTQGAAVAPGGEARAVLLLENGGNAGLTVALAFAGIEPGFSLRVAEGATSGLVVPASGKLQISLSYRAPANAAPGGRDFTLTVAPSHGDALSLPFPVEVLATHGLTLRVVAPPAPLSSAHVEIASADFEIGNPGNAAARVALTFDAPLRALWLVSPAGTSAVSTPAAPFAVPAFSSLTVRASFAPAFAPRETLAAVRITAESFSGDTGTQVVTVERLRNDAGVTDLEIRPVRGAPEAGVLHTVFANISNAGPGVAVGLEAVLTANGAVVGRLQLAPLSPGLARLIQFDFVPRQAETELVLHLVSPEGGLDRDLGNNDAYLRYDVAVPSSGPSATQRAAVPVAAASLSIFALAALALSEIGKSTLISVLFLPLYVKLKPDEVLDQYLRGQIHGFIIANPGEHYNAIKDQLGVTNGALAYHLRVLERSGHIRPVRDGMYKRFYPVGVKIPRRKRLSPFQAAIVRAVRANPDVSQKRMAELLGVSNQVVNYNVKLLEDAGILKVDRSARASKVTLGPEAPPADEGLAAPPAPAQPASP